MPNIKDAPVSQQKLRVLMLAPQPWFQPRGTPFSVLHRIKALTYLGHHVDLATYPIGQNIDIENLTIHRSTRIPFIKTVKVGPSKTKLFLDVFMIYLTFKLLLKNKYDLIHTHEEASFWGAFFAQVFKIPHLYDMHSSLPQQLINFKFTRFKPLLKIFDWLERYTIRNSDAVITICPELQSYMQAQFPEKGSILIENVADNSIVFPTDRDRKNELLDKYGLRNKRIVLYYGTFEPYQGIDLFINSAQSLIKTYGDSIRFVLVGGSENQIKSYRDLANRLNLLDYLVFTGFVQPQVIPAFVEIADVLVSPRLKGNNSPLKIYSYLRSGKPIVATRHITHTQLLDESVSVLTDIDPEAFARGISSMLENETKKQQLVTAAKKLADEKYSYQEYLQKTRVVIDLALNSRKQDNKRAS